MFKNLYFVDTAINSNLVVKYCYHIAVKLWFLIVIEFQVPDITKLRIDGYEAPYHFCGSCFGWNS